MTCILLISDIHANYPALQSIEEHFSSYSFDHIINCGDSLVYGPFPNETLSWLKKNKAISILGNTDKKVIKLLKGESFKKPSNPEKRIMYTWTAEQLDNSSKKYLLTLKKQVVLNVSANTENPQHTATIGVFHGSPEKHHEFLFSSTPDRKFIELAAKSENEIIVFGHSHDPFHKKFGHHHFVNPGSVGRMFDGNPEASCAVLKFSAAGILVNHYRLAYNIEETVQRLHKAALPSIYGKMYRLGKKTN